jgi:hypothetical protein
MTWKVVEKDGKHCVVKSDDGSTVKCYADKAAADAQRKALYANYKLEQDQDKVMLEGVGPALIAVAITSKPHLDQRSANEASKRIQVVKEGDKKLVKVPLFKKALYRHPKGDLSFNDKFINRLVSNFQNKVTGKPVYLDFRHGDQYGVLAYLDPEDGGRIEMGQDNWLYAYGEPTVDNIEQMVKQWPHASVEFATDYESNFVQKLSADDLTEISIEKLLENLVEQTEEFMTKKLTLGTKVITLEGEVQDGQVTEIETAYKELSDKVTSLEAKVVELTPEPEPKLPEPIRLRLEALETENKKLEQERINDKVNLVLEKARTHKDSRGYVHDKVFLELVEAGLKHQAYEQDGVVIKLEASDGDKPKLGDLVNFYNTILMTMLEKVPGTVPTQGKTNADDIKLEGSNGHFTEDELKEAVGSFWKD